MLISLYDRTHKRRRVLLYKILLWVPAVEPPQHFSIAGAGSREYLAALLLTLFCLVVGICAALAITIRAVKYIAFVIVVLAGRKNL